MKIRIDETIYEGTAAEIMDQLRLAVFDTAANPDVESYIQQLRTNFIRMTDRDCVLPEVDTEARSRAMFAALAEVGALEILGE